MQPSGAKKNKLAHAMFSNEGPNRTKPEVTRRPNVTPNMYKETNKNIIITGGSSGIGKSLINKLKKYNCKIYNFSRGNNLDITDFNSIKEYINENISDVDILINCAGFINLLILFYNTKLL